MGWEIDLELSRRVEKLQGKTKLEQKKLIYQWVKTEVINFAVFDRLIKLLEEEAIY
jgi:hypothetical protein